MYQQGVVVALWWLTEELHYLVSILKDGGGAVGKNPPPSAGDPRDGGSIPESGKSHEEGMAAHPRTPAWRTPWNSFCENQEATRVWNLKVMRKIKRAHLLLCQVSVNFRS